MKITRRLFAFVFLSASLIALTFTPAASKPAGHYLAFVGTYTEKTDSKGIYAFDFDAETGHLTHKHLAAETTNPSWVAVLPNGKFVYAANESGPSSTITAFSIDAKFAKLTQRNQLSALGADPCYLSFDKTGKYLFAANYSSGNVVVFPILPDGKLGEHTANVKDAGALGPNKQRQEGPHAHWVHVSPDNRFVLVSDLGLDAILSYRFNSTNGTLTPNNPPLAKLTPGSGPRHVAFSANGKYLYVISELANTVTAFSYNSDKGTLFQLQILSTLPGDFTGRNDDAEIAVDSSSKWLFASNRGHDTIAVFAINSDGTLHEVNEYPTGGKEPRHFTIDPTGKFLLAENQNSNSIVVFHIDPTSGALSKISQADNIPSPVCLAFLGH